MELVNVPEVVPSVVLLFDVVGVVVVPQQIPEIVTGVPPFDKIVPPALAAYFDIPLAAIVVSVGAIAFVVKLACGP
jgi:dihydroxyacid dehydratase/phosphogluconate dehydratase